MVDRVPEVIRCKLLVVGAGPAGIAAALCGIKFGAQVVLIDQQRDPGGQIWRGQWQALNAGKAVDSLAKPQLQALERAIRTQALRYLGSCRVVLALSANRLRCDGENAAIIQFNRLVLACGARELFLPFPGWHTPGVTGAGGLQLMLKEGARLTGKRVVIAGSGPLLLAAADTLQQKGMKVVAILEQQSRVGLVRFAARLWRWPELFWQALMLRWRTRRIPYRAGQWIARAEGESRLSSVHWQDQSGNSGQIECTWLACSFGLQPNQEILALLDAQLLGTDSQQTTRPDIYVAGEMSQIGGVRHALHSGAIAAARALDNVPPRRLIRALARWQAYSEALRLAFKLRGSIHRLASDETIFCRCENVTAGAVRACSNFREAKLSTRFGMGPCQGRICGAAANVLFAWPIQHTRAPLVPTPIATFLGSDPEPLEPTN